MFGICIHSFMFSFLLFIVKNNEAKRKLFLRINILVILLLLLLLLFLFVSRAVFSSLFPDADPEVEDRGP